MKAFKQVNLVTCDADFHVYRNGLLVIHEDKILVNCHTHSAMTTLRGIQDDSNLHEWLEDYIWPAERDFTPEVTTQAVKLALIEMLQTGTTTFNDMYNPNGVEIGQIHEVVAGSKMRCYFSPTLFSSDVETTEETLARTRIIIEEILAYNDERFKVMVAPHAPYSCSKDLLKGSLKLAQELQLKLHIHVAETQAENGMILERYGKRPLAFLKDLGYLEHDGVFAHGVELNEREIAELAVSNIHIAHNPISNLKLASGIAPVTDLVQTGVIVGLATDSVASNNNLDMFEESRTAALLQKMRTGDATQFTIEQALKTMTIEGAKALGMDDQIGSLEVGKQADFLIIHPKGKVHLYPEETMLSHLIYAAKGNDVKDVYIAGEQVVKNGQVLTVELSDL